MAGRNRSRNPSRGWDLDLSSSTRYDECTSSKTNNCVKSNGSKVKCVSKQDNSYKVNSSCTSSVTSKHQPLANYSRVTKTSMLPAYQSEHPMVAYEGNSRPDSVRVTSVRYLREEWSYTYEHSPQDGHSLDATPCNSPCLAISPRSDSPSYFWP